MKAALKVGREKFAVVDVDTPSIGKNDVLVEVHYCLICAWCYETWLKDDTQSPLGPGISGHEVSGVVKEIGSEVRNFKTGDKVLVYDLIHCGECEECNAGKETFCKSSGSIHKGYAEYVKVPERNLFHSSVGLDLRTAGMITDMVGTPMRAIRRAFEVNLPRKICTVWGLGPVGLITLQCLKTFNGVEKVIALDPLPNRREMALKLGGDQALDPNSEESANLIKAENSDRGCDYAFNCAIRSEEILHTVMTTIRRDGYLMNITGAAKSWNQLEKRVDGSFYFWRNEYKENAELVTSGLIDVKSIISHEYPLEQINEAMEMRAKHPEESLKIAVRMV